MATGSRSTLHVLVLAALFLVSLNSVMSVRLNEIQILSAHNSYHVAADDALQVFGGLDDKLSDYFDSVRYTHPDLSEQLQDLHVRAFEFDVFSDTAGGKFSANKGGEYAGFADAIDNSVEMAEPGFKVLHLDNIDYRTTCKSLTSPASARACLSQIRRWSDGNPDHVPIIVKLELKKETMIEWLESSSPTAAVAVSAVLGGDLPRSDPIGEATVLALAAEVLDIFGAAKLLTPDELRGDAATMADALEAAGPDAFWPLLDDIRGRIIVVLAEADSHMVEAYGLGLVGSPMFTRTWIGKPSEQAGWVLDNPRHAVFAEVEFAGATRHMPELLSTGFIVFGRADQFGSEAHTQDYSNYTAVVASGAHVILSDYIVAPAFSDYHVRLPCGDNAPACDLTQGTLTAVPEALNASHVDLLLVMDDAAPSVTPAAPIAAPVRETQKVAAPTSQLSALESPEADPAVTESITRSLDASGSPAGAVLCMGGVAVLALVLACGWW